MPLYEYECRTCGSRFERIRKFSDPPVTECVSCGGPVDKLLSSPAIQFKGAGWYITDYARKGGESGKAQDPAKAEKAGDGGSAPSAETSPSSDAAPKAAKTEKAADATRPASAAGATKPSDKTV
jgi:putative FmdB family regulatory protein